MPGSFILDKILAPEDGGSVTLVYRDYEGMKLLSFMQSDHALPASQPGGTDVRVGMTKNDETGDPEKVVFAVRVDDPFAQFSQIGSSAEVQTVQIGDIAAEYVVGEWLPQNNPLDFAVVQPGTTAVIENEWEAERVQRLRWEANDIFYEIRYGCLGLPMEELVNIAESLP
jgi:hypothetical protein